MLERIKSGYKAVEERVINSKYTPKVMGALTAGSIVLGSAMSASAEELTTQGGSLASQLATSLQSTVTETYTALIPLLGIVMSCNFAWKKVRRTVKA